jgi:intracellular septation protein
MQQILDLAPLVAFFVAYSLGGIYVATAVLMACMVIVLVVDYARNKRVSAMHAVMAGLIFAFGTATLILHDQRFIQWKPTVFLWMLSLALLGSMWIGKQPLIQRLIGKSLEGQVHLTRSTWRKLNLLWTAFYALLGAANLYVVFNYSEATWVKFKVIGITGATFVFLIAQVFWIMRKAPETPPPTSAEP